MQHPIGVCTWIYGCRDFAAIACRLQSHSLAGCEIFLGESPQDLSVIRSIFERLSLKLYSLTPVNVDLASEDSAIRQSSRNYYKQLVRDAWALSVPRITCHGLVKDPSQRPPQSKEALIDSVHEVCCFAEQFGIQVLFEPLHRGLVSFVNTTWQALDLLARVGHPSLHIVLDTYHMEQEGEDFFESILAAGTHLKILHASDSKRLAIGSGNIDFASCLRGLMTQSEPVPILIECPPSLTGPGYIMEHPYQFFEVDHRVATSRSALKSELKNIYQYESRKILC